MAVKAAQAAKRRPLSEERDFLKILYYGDPGTGKTTHLASLTHIGPMIFVDAESGIKRAAMTKREIPLEQLTVDRTVTFDNLEKMFFELKGQLEDDPDAVAGVAIDSLTEVQKKLMDVILVDSVARTQKKGMERSRFDIYKEDWGVNTEQLRQLTRKFRDLPCHVGFACLPKRDQDDDGAVIYGPALTPAFQTDVMGYVDIICHTRVEQVGDEEIFVGDFHRAGKFIAKDRYGMLPKTLVDPTFDRVVQYVNGELTADSDPIVTLAREKYAEEKAKIRGDKPQEEKK